MINDIKKFQLRLAICIIFIIFIYGIFAIFSDIDKISSVFNSTFLDSYLIPMGILFSISLVLRSFIQKRILEQLDIKISFKQSIPLYFAGLSMLITPFGIGQTIKSYFLFSKFDIPHSKSIPLVLAERLYDFISIIILLWISTLFFFGNESFLIVTFSSFFLILILLFAKNRSINNYFRQKISKFSLFSRNISNYDQVICSISEITKLTKIVKIMPLVFIAILIESFVIYIGFISFHIDLGYLHSIQIFYSSLLMGIFSLLPGGVGVTESSFVALMVREGISSHLSAAIILLLRFVTIWSVSIIGFVVTFYFFKIIKK